MGLRFQKSINLGPFRVNVSKSGVGFSVGTRGARTGVSAKGRRYTTVSAPGTGVSYQHTHRKGKFGCLLVIVAFIGGIAGAAAMVARSAGT